MSEQKDVLWDDLDASTQLFLGMLASALMRQWAEILQDQTIDQTECSRRTGNLIRTALMEAFLYGDYPQDDPK